MEGWQNTEDEPVPTWRVFREQLSNLHEMRRWTGLPLDFQQAFALR